MLFSAEYDAYMAANRERLEAIFDLSKAITRKPDFQVRPSRLGQVPVVEAAPVQQPSWLTLLSSKRYRQYQADQAARRERQVPFVGTALERAAAPYLTNPQALEVATRSREIPALPSGSVVLHLTKVHVPHNPENSALMLIIRSLTNAYDSDGLTLARKGGGLGVTREFYTDGSEIRGDDLPSGDNLESLATRLANFSNTSLK